MKTVFRNNRIRVEKQNVFARALFQSLVAGFCKSDIFGISNKSYNRKFWRQVVYAIISRAIVYYNYFCLYALNRLQYRTKALFQEMFYIIIDYDYRKLQII